jgi:hypothetical protein
VHAAENGEQAQRRPNHHGPGLSKWSVTHGVPPSRAAGLS